MRKTSQIIWQDAQHQVLFQTLDMLQHPGAANQVLMKLRDYTENHFSLEEHYMQVLDYPDRTAHTQAHNKFRMEIRQLLEQGDEPDEMFREIIALYLTEWLTRHVFGTDKALEAFLLNSAAR